MLPRSLCLLTLLLACLLLAFGCGDDSDDEGGGGTGGGGGETKAANQLTLTADPGGALKFDKTTLATTPGETTLVLKNPSSVPHAVEVEGAGLEEEGKTVGKGGISKVTIDLEAGKYEYYCPVGNHKEAGMEGSLTVAG